MKVFETELRFLVNDTGISLYRDKENSCRWFNIYWIDSSEAMKVTGLKDWFLLDYSTMMNDQYLAVRFEPSFFEATEERASIHVRSLKDVQSGKYIGSPERVSVWIEGISEGEALMALLAS